MALLQISDPIAAPTAVGIDLGTTHSLVAYVTPTGDPVALRVCDDDPLLPSVVHYAVDGTVRVGKDADSLAQAFPRDTIVSVKRFMGRSADDPETTRLGPYRFVSPEGSVVQFRVASDRIVTPVEVSAEILRELKRRAEKWLGEIHHAVITVPAYFDDAQRQATRDAGELAGLSVLRLLNEPTAAALAYGLQEKKNGTFAVYDLGGGTFDITILSLDDGVFQVRATGGDSQLGGDDMDRALATHFYSQLSDAQKGNTPSIETASPHLVRALLSAARQAKHKLSSVDNVAVDVAVDDFKHTFVTSRAEFEALIAPLLDRTLVACKRALRDAALDRSELDGVILVGGASRVPAVRACVAAFFQKEPHSDIDPDQVVALGAAYQADLLTRDERRDNVLLLDVLPLSLGVEAMGGVVERILSRNTAIPAAAAQIFTTYADNQTGLVVHVVQGERDLAKDCRSLATFTLKNIPPMPSGMARIEVRFAVDENGILTVSAKELGTGFEMHVEVKPSHGLSEEDMEQMLLDAFENAEQDVALRALREQQVEAERILKATKKAIDEDSHLLQVNERSAIEAAMRALEESVVGSNHRRISSLIEALDTTSRDFAGRRMDASMKRALGGQVVDKLEREVSAAEGIDRHLGR